jgi:hypothetical protein
MVQVVLDNRHHAPPSPRTSTPQLRTHARNARASTALPQAQMCVRTPIEGLSCHVSVLRHARNGGREGAIELAPWANVASLDAGGRA